MTVQILQGDCRAILPTLPAESVDCIVTSPPYFGLRDYGTAKWEGGDASCDHGQERVARRNAGAQSGVAQEGSLRDKPLSVCRCGARRSDPQIGLEATPDAYVKELVGVFRECRRVLKNSGTCWVNLGDSYAGPNNGYSGDDRPSNRAGSLAAGNRGARACGQVRKMGPGLKTKDLIGIPWLVAFALRADGWYLRSDIIWSKPNPMPESVTDRPTRAHEYLFLLSKSGRYYYDATAIREPPSEALLKQVAEGYAGHDTKPYAVNGAQSASGTKSRIIEGARKKIDKQRGHGRRHDGFNARWDALTKKEQQALGSNKRSVWTVATAPFSEAHFATFPPDLIEPCIKAGCPEGGTVLDPFGGAGTTGLVADRHQRNAILIELNADYAAMSERRLNGDAGMFSSVERGKALLGEAAA